MRPTGKERTDRTVDRGKTASNGGEFAWLSFGGETGGRPRDRCRENQHERRKRTTTEKEKPFKGIGNTSRLASAMR